MGPFWESKSRLGYMCSFYAFVISFLCRLFAMALFRSYFACLFCPREVAVVSFYYAACGHCVIGMGPFIRIAIIACVAFPKAAILLLQNFGDIIFSCRS